MRRVFLLVLVLANGPGCTFFEGGEGGGGGDDDDCLDVPLDEPTIEPVPLRDPETLLCQTFGGGPPCDPACGPCPAIDEAPVPSWGICGSECEPLDEATCLERAGCRVVRSAGCAVTGACETDFLGCFPTDMAVLADVPCIGARNGQTCSQLPGCTAFHHPVACTDPPCAMAFQFCMPDGASPGGCEPATCDAAPPPCPEGTTPGVEEGCYTGVCIANELCGLL